MASGHVKCLLGYFIFTVQAVAVLGVGSLSYPCARDCREKPNGDYQSCAGCTVYATCCEGMLIDFRPCPLSWTGRYLVWDDVAKRCLYTSTTCDPASVIPNIDGHWADWGAWGRCSRTCGGGKRFRRRSCSDPEPYNKGRPCPGARKEREECGMYACPNCELPCDCKAGGCECHWNYPECTLCICPNRTITGQLFIDGTTTPLACTAIYPETRGWEAIAFSDSEGIFVIPDITDLYGFRLETRGFHLASRANLVFFTLDSRKKRATSDCGQTYTDSFFTSHPTNLRLTTQDTAILTALATCNADSCTCTWFRNRNRNGRRLVESTNKCNTSEPMQLNLDKMLKGSYEYDVRLKQCTNGNVCTKIYSNTATVEVTDANDVCPPAKAVSRTLPRGCEAGMSTSYSHTSCTYISCGDTNHCCVAKSQKEVTIDCEGNSNDFRVVDIDCDCKSNTCPKLDHVTITGSVKVNTTPLRSHTFGAIGETTIWPDTSYSGDIKSFKLETKAREIALVFSPSSRNTFVPDINTIEFTPNVFVSSLSINHFVQLVETWPFQTAKNTGRRKRSLSAHDYAISTIPGLAGVSIPDGSFLHLDGTVPASAAYDDVTWYFPDLATYEGIQSAPGAAIHYDSEGNKRYLWFYALVGYLVHNQTDYSNPVFISGEFDLIFDFGAMNVPPNPRRHGSPWLADIYQLNVRTGTWVNLQPVSEESFCGRLDSEMHPNRTSTAVFLPDMPHIGVAKKFRRSELCQTKVHVNYNFDGAVTVSIYSMHPDTDLYGSYTTVATGLDGYACLTHPCGYEHRITVRSDIECFPFNHHLPDDCPYEEEGTDIIFHSPLEVYSPFGPVHQLVHDTCKDNCDYYFNFQQAPAFVDNFEADENPFYTFHETGPPPALPSWPGPPVEACMIQVEVKVASSHIATVMASSVYDAPIGWSVTTIPYGIDTRYVKSVDDALVCLRVKCPGDIYNREDMMTIPGQDINVVLTVNPPPGFMCTSTYNPPDAGTVELVALTDTILKILLKPPPLADPGYGLYSVTEPSLAEADTRVHNVCSSGTVVLAEFDCTTPS